MANITRTQIISAIFVFVLLVLSSGIITSMFNDPSLENILKKFGFVILFALCGLASGALMGKNWKNKIR